MKSKGGIRVDELDPARVGKDGERWRAVLDALRAGEMPPDDAPQPPAAQRRAAIRWLEAALADAARAAQAQAVSPLRRLTREQHSNTLRDLLGVDTDYARLLPPESPSALGMHNDGRVLASSALHLEQATKIARQAVDRALSLGSPPPAWRFRFVFGPQKSQPARKIDLGYQSQPLAPEEFLVETFGGRGPVPTPTLTPAGPLRDRCFVDLRGSTDHDHAGGPRRYAVDDRGLSLMPAKPHVEREAQIWQGPNPNVALVLRDFPTEGAFVLRVTVSRAAPRVDPVWLRAFLGNRLDDGMQVASFGGLQQVEAPPGRPQVLEFRGRLENLPVPIVDPEDKAPLANLMVVGVWNDALTTRPDVTTPAVVIRSIEIEGPITDAWPAPSHRRVFFDDAGQANPAAYAREILARFLPRAFRRPPSAAQMDRYLGYWRRQIEGGIPFREAVRDTLVAALSSPSFLHHVEDTTAAPPGRRQPLDDHALASRLSYLLWNSMPDDELLRLAFEGKLRANLAAQAARLLRDPRAQAFFQTWAEQWLELGAADRVRVDVKQHPRYTRFVKEDMRLEAIGFIEHLFRENRPITELVDADYTLLNAHLARYYGVEGVVGPAFRPVKLPRGSRPGGLLTQGSFLVGHSTGDDSHPIKRGVWLAKKLLDDPPPPPPPNVPEIDRENPAIARMPVKAQLEMHRKKEACRECHRKLDPWGIPLEGFDAAGMPRTEVRKEHGGETFTTAVDARATLPDGTQVAGVEALRRHLVVDRRDQLRRSVTRHLVAYALGRTPGFADERAVDDIGAGARAAGDGLGDLLRAVIASELFQSK